MLGIDACPDLDSQSKSLYILSHHFLFPCCAEGQASTEQLEQFIIIAIEMHNLVMQDNWIWIRQQESKRSLEDCKRENVTVVIMINEPLSHHKNQSSPQDVTQQIK